jgi:hypothetical protein
VHVTATAELRGELGQFDTACFKLKPHRIGPPDGEAKRRQFLTAAAAELGAKRVEGVPENPVEQVVRPDPGIAAANSELGGDLERALG